MNGKWKRNTVVAATALLVCTAAGLNWKYTQKELPESEETGSKILGEATLVSGREETEQEELPDHTSGGSDYFASARLTRQQARDSALALLQEAAEQENAGEGSEEASRGIQVLAANTMKEAQIENLVTAKGYEDCVVFMGDDSVSVVVAVEEGELTGEDVAKIKDITMAESGYTAGNIKIMAAN